MARERKATTTSNFGVGLRESHDSTPFYQRFRTPELSADDRVLPPAPVAEPFVCGDSRAMSTIADGSVALVVTSPPYFAGKQYEEELERDGIPASYLEYLEMLSDVFADCVRVLEPGGRIAVNVANLGRKPYRSLSADVIGILEHLGLLLRGELIWQKGEGASGSCAWGSFRSAANPVVRDITERVIVASKGRFDRARSIKQRRAEGLPWRNTLLTDDFLNLTLDVWHMPTESARRVGHPAPFPVELPAQLIRLYTYEDDLVLDPFAGSGSSLVAAAILGRRYVGYDLDPTYVELCRQRVAEAEAAHAAVTSFAAAASASSSGGAVDGRGGETLAPGVGVAGTAPVSVARLVAETDGMSAAKLAMRAVEQAGFTGIVAERRVSKAGLTVDMVATDQAGREWRFEIPGPFTAYRGGLVRTEAAWRAVGRATALRGESPDTPVVLLATELPRRRSDADLALRSAGPSVICDVVDLFDPSALARLRAYAAGTVTTTLAGFWPER